MDITRDRAGFKEMLVHTKGVSQVPVIVEGDSVKIGYGGS